MNLSRTTIWGGVVTAVRMMAGLVVSKVVATYAGPSGLALLGQFQNFIGLIQGLSGNLFQNGIVKYSSEHRENLEKLGMFIGAVSKLALGISIFISVLLVVLQDKISIWVMQQAGYSQVVMTLGLAVTIMAASSVALSMLNGLGEIRSYLKISALSSVIYLLVALALLWRFGFIGAFYALVLAPTIVSVFVFWELRAYLTMIGKAFKLRIDRKTINDIAEFALIGLCVVIPMPLAILGVRSELVSQVGWQDTGYWQSVLQVSNIYLSVIGMGIALYHLPRLSRIHNVAEIRAELRGYIRFAFPLMCVVATSIFIARDLILELLYSSDFKQAESLFIFQLVGDIFKIIAYGYSHLLVAKKMTLVFVISQLVFSALFYVLTITFIPLLGVKSPVVIYMLMNGVYFILMGYVVRKYLLRLGHE